MTIKEITKKLNLEQFDIKNIPAFVVVEGQRFEIENVELVDHEAHFTVGPPIDVDAQLENGETMYGAEIGE